MSRESSAKVAAAARMQADASTPPGLHWAGLLDRAALFTLLVIVAIRPLVSERYDLTLRAMERATEAANAISPATTAGFNLAIWLAALATALAAALRRTDWRWTGMEIGWCVLALAAAVSTVATSNQRIALNASVDWLTAIVLAMVLANLCRDRFRVNLVLAVLIASGAASLAKCSMQAFVELAETRAHYEQTKEEFWGQQGVALDDPVVDLFERRMRADEASGFLPYSNAQGALLSLSGFAALALVAAKGRRWWQSLVVVGAGVLMWLGMSVTGSRGAILAAGLALVMWPVLRRGHVRLRPHWRKLLICGWGGVLLAILAVVSLGTARGGLPGSSLNFRWQYWTVTRVIVAERLWTGTGALNFDRFYLPVKPIDYPEEIRDPHNFALSVVAQWGLAGGLGLALLLAGGSLVLARAWGRHTPDDEPTPVESHTAHTHGRLWVLSLAVAFVFLRRWLLYDPWNHGPGEQALAWFDTGFYGLLWCAILVGAVWFGNEGRTAEIDLCRMPLLLGLGAFLLHNTIDFAVFVPGVLTPAAAMGGILLARPPRSLVGFTWPRRRMAVPMVVGALGTIAVLGLVFVPVSRSSRHVLRARNEPWETAAASYELASRADTLDPTPLVELAALRAQSQQVPWLNEAAGALDAAIERDPEDIHLYQFRAALLELRYRVSGETADLRESIRALRKCVELYPASPDRHADLAALLDRAADELADAALLHAAVTHYRRALVLDEARPGTDEARRWTPARRAEITTRLHAAQKRVSG